MRRFAAMGFATGWSFRRIYCRYAIFGLFGFLSLFCMPAVGAQVSGLYEAEVPVAGQDTEHRNQAIIEAFRRMLVKVTGSRGIIRNPQLAEDIPRAPHYVQQYRYRLAPPEAETEAPPPVAPGSGVENAAPPPPAEPVRMLRVRFDEQAVNRLLRRRELPVWGRTRPATLMWLTAERDGERTLLAPEMDEPTHAALLEVTAERGVPLLFPLMDLEDQSRLQVSDIWGGFGENIRTASERYGPDAIMTGRLIQFAPDLWRAGWTLYLGDDTLIWDSEGDTLEMAVEAGLQSGVDRLASRFAPLGEGGGLSRVRLHVAGVEALKSYARVSRYLAAQEVVERAELLDVEPDAVTFALRVRGGGQALEQSIALSGVLRPLSPEEIDIGAGPEPASSSVAPPVLEEPTLHYRLRP